MQLKTKHQLEVSGMTFKVGNAIVSRAISQCSSYWATWVKGAMP